MVLPRQLVSRGFSPTSPIALLLACRIGAPSGPLLSGFRFESSRWGHPSGSGLSQSSIGSKLLLHLPGVCFESSRWGHPVGSWFVPVLDRNDDLFGAPSLVVGVWPSRWGHPFWVEWRFSAPSIGTEGFLLSSILSCFAMGSPGGSSVGFPSLDRNEAVFG